MTAKASIACVCTVTGPCNPLDRPRLRLHTVGYASSPLLHPQVRGLELVETCCFSAIFLHGVQTHTVNELTKSVSYEMNSGTFEDRPLILRLARLLDAADALNDECLP